MGFLLSKLLPLALYPLGLALLLQLSALVGRRRRWAGWVSGAGLGLLWISAMPVIARHLAWSLEERSAALTPDPMPKADAVVVLGGGLRPAVAPRRNVEVNEAGDRLLTGLRLIRQGKAPLLVVSGGQVSFAGNDPAPPEATSTMALAMELGLKPEAIVTNDRSRTTAEEARDIGALAKQRGWRSVLLVTSATHLPRALASFERLSGLRVVPVACDFQFASRSLWGRPTVGSMIKDGLPDAEALLISTVVLKEYVGQASYRLLGRS
ncbi:YdcF family protein [Cyanobium sp. Morenito 9A2]|uniref:YdcF family protein n=1 Tax=Cyanobium sp. Morenito 9A2 TaxID=2823718 RepID=UPI0020CC6246|nr:YdcF family protein [Cyanobium sp. Morenito 9A2]MCP9849501.1 YdcF family protein [Cyanobium sp. Morenito 9A2]